MKLRSGLHLLPAGPVAALAAACAVAGCGRASPPPAAAAGPAPIVVEAVAAIARTVPVTIAAVGRLDAAATISIAPLVNARLEAVLVADGADVKAGDPLLRFDARAYAAQLAHMQGEQAASAAQVAALQARWDRSRDLISGGFVSPQDAQEQLAGLAAAKAALAAATAGVAQAQIDLENCVPKAPFDGRIGLLDSATVAGNFLAAGSAPLLTVRALDRLKVDFTVPESALPLLQQMAAGGRDLKVVATAHGDSTRRLEGPVAAFDNTVDPRTRSLAVRAVVANPGRDFWPGEFVDVQLVVGSEENATLVPFQAINTGPNGPYLYVVADGKAALRPVALGEAVGDLVVVKSGVSPGQPVIVSGQLGLQNGSPVQVSTVPGT